MTAIRFDSSRPGFVWLGGRRLGKLCDRAYEGQRSEDSDEAAAWRTLSDMAILVSYLGRAVECVHEGRFDRRYSRCVAKNAAMVDLYIDRVARYPGPLRGGVS